MQTLKADPRFLILAGLLFSASAIATSSADAQIASATASYDRGVLLVRGKTAKPRQLISLNRFHIKRSNRAGDFIFRQTRIPRDCLVRLRAEGDSRILRIDNCPLRRRAF